MIHIADNINTFRWKTRKTIRHKHPQRVVAADFTPIPVKASVRINFTC